MSTFFAPHSADWKLYVDGASRGNPGPASVGCVLHYQEAIVARLGYYVGTATNNYAEYAALIVGLHAVRSQIQPGQTIHILADSQLLVRQVMGQYRVKEPTLQLLHRQVIQGLQGLAYTIEHIPRALNAGADACANTALDRKTALPAHLEFLYVGH